MARMTNNPIHLIRTLDRSHTFVRWSFLLTLVIAVVRALDLSRPINSAISISLFVLGWAGAHFIFSQEAWLVQKVDKIVDKGLDTLPPLEGVENREPVSEGPRSFLKQGLIILILPVLAVFLLTSTRSPIGLGIIWGVMCIYGYDMLSFLFEKKAEIVDPYFGAFSDDPQTLRSASVVYLIFVALFALLFMLARLAGL